MSECPAMQCVQDGHPPCSACYKTPCSSATLWGWLVSSWIVLKRLVPLMMLLKMHQPYLYQPWRLDRCNPFIHSRCDFLAVLGGWSRGVEGCLPCFSPATRSIKTVLHGCAQNLTCLQVQTKPIHSDLQYEQIDLLKKLKMQNGVVHGIVHHQ